MKSKARTKVDEKWLKQLGTNIERIIKKKGYSSVYDFWVQKAGDQISRATLNFIIAGKSDPKATTLRTLARLLKVDIKDFFS